MLIAIVTVSNTVKHALPCDSSTQGDCSGYGGYDMGGGIIIGAGIFFCGLCIAIVAGGLVGWLALMGGIGFGKFTKGDPPRTQRVWEPMHPWRVDGTGEDTTT